MYRVQTGTSFSSPLPEPKKTPCPSEAPPLPAGPLRALPRPRGGFRMDPPALECNHYELPKL